MGRYAVGAEGMEKFNDRVLLLSFSCSSHEAIELTL